MTRPDPRRGPRWPSWRPSGAAARAGARPPRARPAIEAAAARDRRGGAAGDAPVYGVNTGFGKLASVKIPAERHRARCSAT